MNSSDTGYVLRTNENEKLISDFMGDKNVFKYTTKKGDFIGYYIATNEHGSIDFEYEGINFLSYTSSYDWLMPVVDKISKVVIKGIPPFNSDQFVRVEIVPNGYINITNLREYPIMSNVSIEGGLLNAILKAVINFVNWYNQNKEKCNTIK